MVRVRRGTARVFVPRAWGFLTPRPLENVKVAFYSRGSARVYIPWASFFAHPLENAKTAFPCRGGARSFVPRTWVFLAAQPFENMQVAA